jgi:hypothetical protein
MTAALAAAPVLTLATMEALAVVGPVAVGATGLVGAAGLIGARTVRRSRPANRARKAARAVRRASAGHAGSASRRRNTMASGSVGVGTRRRGRAASGGAQRRGTAASTGGTHRARAAGHRGKGTTAGRAGRGRVAGLLTGRRRTQGTAGASTATTKAHKAHKAQAKTARRTAAQAARRARGRAYRRAWDRATSAHRAVRGFARRRIAGTPGRGRKLLAWAVTTLSALLGWTAGVITVGTTAWVRLAHRIGNHVRAFRLSWLTFLAEPFAGLGPDLRRLFALLTGVFTPAGATLPAVIPAVPAHETGDTTMSDLSGVTTNLRPLIDAIRESTPLGGGEAPHAIEVAKWHDDLAELMDALATRLRADADIAAETLPAESGAHEITASLGSSASSFAVEIEEASAAWRAVNGTRFERLTSDDARERQWDHSTRPDA